jgi:oxygen-independent coproporphyrinogen-3 oxidase
VNRVSIGVQSFDEAALRFLGREHSGAQARRAVELAREIFPRLSFDLIYALPGQDVAAWRAAVGDALALAADHLSLYQLTIEPGTKFFNAHARRDFLLPEVELAAELYDATVEEAGLAGLAAYEISNFARPGAESRHNLAYWRYLDYAGVGPGAHGRVSLEGTLFATSRHRAPEAWAGLVERDGTGPVERAREALLMGLRLAEGISLSRFAERTGVALMAAVDEAALDDLVEVGYLVLTETHLRATAEGRKRLDALLPVLVR